MPKGPITTRKNISRGFGLVPGLDLLLLDGNALEKHGIPYDAVDLCFGTMPSLGVRMPHIKDIPDQEYTLDVFASRITAYWGFHKEVHREIKKPRIIFP